MFFNIILASISFTAIDVMCCSIDMGANVKGASLGPRTLLALDAVPGDRHVTHIEVDTEERGYEGLRKALRTVYECTCNSYLHDRLPVVLGGDHSVAIGSVAASARECAMKGLRLGVLWCDAHPDFHTVTTSRSKNIHGMVLGVLCHHTIPNLQFGPELDTSSIIQFGIRDVDKEELTRLDTYEVQQARTIEDIVEWCSHFDRIHLSFDMDVCDPSIAPGVSTPVPLGLTRKQCVSLMREIRETGKLQCVDWVEFNPLADRASQTGLLCKQLNMELLGFFNSSEEVRAF